MDIRNPKGAGRKPGSTVNAETALLRKSTVRFLNANFMKMQREWDALEGRDKVELYIKMMQFGLPKLQAITLTEEPPNPLDLSTLSDDELELMAKMVEKATNISLEKPSAN